MQEINLTWPGREIACWLFARILPVTRVLRSHWSLLGNFRKVQSSERTHLAWGPLGQAGTGFSNPGCECGHQETHPSQDTCVPVRQGLLQEKLPVWEACGGIWPIFVWGLVLDHNLPLQQLWNSVTWETLCPWRSLQSHSVYGFTDMSLIQPYKMGLSRNLLPPSETSSSLTVNARMCGCMYLLWNAGSWVS